jgi:hypothetical protein
MKLAAGIGIGAVATAALASVLVGGGSATDVWLGMAGPALAVVTAWIVVERTFRTRPERLTAVQARLFAAKMLFFGAYVGGVLGTELARPYPFMFAFTVYFVILYGVHAFALHRLMSVGATH